MSEGLASIRETKGLRYASLMRISIIIAHNESKLLNYFVVTIFPLPATKDPR